jgi:hypothetical protein
MGTSRKDFEGAKGDNSSAKHEKYATDQLRSIGKQRNLTGQLKVKRFLLTLFLTEHESRLLTASLIFARIAASHCSAIVSAD